MIYDHLWRRSTLLVFKEVRHGVQGSTLGDVLVTWWTGPSGSVVVRSHRVSRFSDVSGLVDDEALTDRDTGSLTSVTSTTRFSVRVNPETTLTPTLDDPSVVNPYEVRRE